ncbi:endonuclease/exonuclease/phosphatase family protein [Polaribacter sp. Hel_I_88]|uniref:endonuclease/exonuclease/phosphatase family protein n=1 Tax=Polaribacter sp. Hel_I_88 TaxID=1250006 RepID=UPI0005636F9C|nr:endonuclease/exonuclease/phosphatase family protein [Polaribacter sp. Hel_I_88]
MFKKFLIGFGVLAILLTITPFIAVDYWWVRAFDFPHLQLTFLTVLAITTYFIKFNFKSKKDYLFLTILIGCCVFQFSKIYPYTTFANFDVLNASKNEDNSIKIITANVLQKNKKSEKIINEINVLKPDIILLTEVNKRWITELEEKATNTYKYKQEIPLDNAYGMALYSNLELINPQTNYLVSDSIPSIEAKVILKEGDTLQLYAIHPTPPMPQENAMSTNRDTEMMMTAKMSLEADFPVIVLGDFNDVAWSETSQLFKSVSELLDPRIGRGLYNTYSADSYILKWPLDHIFISKEFRVKKMEVRKDINSDHYPLYTEFSFEPEKAFEQEPTQVTKQDLKAAEDQIEKFKKNDPRTKKN